MNKEFKSKIEKSKALSNTGFFRVSKKTHSRYKRGFCWQYSFREKNGVNKLLYAPTLLKLRFKVIKAGFSWIVVDKEKALINLKKDLMGR